MKSANASGEGLTITIGERESLEARALQLLKKNRWKVTHLGKTRFYTVPSVFSYPFQWFWDSCFHAIVYARLGKIDWAKEELHSLLAVQRKDGFIPQIIFWRPAGRRPPRPWFWWYYLESKGRFSFSLSTGEPRISVQIQPPLLAQAVQRIFESDSDQEFLREIIPRLNRYYAWLLQERDPDRDNLISIIAPFESGLDFSPAFDPVLGLYSPPDFLWLGIRARLVSLVNKFVFDYNLEKIFKYGPFDVEDVLVNSILALNLDVLADLNDRVNDHMNAHEFRMRSRLITDALLGKCWDEERGLFFNLSGKRERRFPVLSIQSLMPVIIPWLPENVARRIIERHLANPREFWPAYPVPTAALCDPTFTEDDTLSGRARHCRGTSWVHLNWYLKHALERLGYDELASYLASSTKEAVQKNNFPEKINPKTGKGCGAKDFGWSTLVVDM